MSPSLCLGDKILLLSDIYVFVAMLNFMLKQIIYPQNSMFSLLELKHMSNGKLQCAKAREFLVLLPLLPDQLTSIEINETLELCN